MTQFRWAIQDTAGQPGSRSHSCQRSSPLYTGTESSTDSEYTRRKDRPSNSAAISSVRETEAARARVHKGTIRPVFPGGIGAAIRAA